MIELDITQFPSETSYLLMLRGAGVPPLDWSEHEYGAAATSLKELSLEDMLGVKEVKNERMGHAVKGLLYLWNGSIQNCAKALPPVGDQEKAYIGGLCHRHAGKFADSKSWLTRAGKHPIHEKVIEYTFKVVDTQTSPILKRFKDMLEFAGEWEANLFVDLLEVARKGDLNSIGEQIIQQIQCKEFEMLFAYCFSEASGKTISTDKPKEAPRQVKRKPAARKKKLTPSVEKLPGKTPAKGKGKEEVDPGIRIPVQCPLCKYVSKVPEKAFGKPILCISCQKHFSIPKSALQKKEPKLLAKK